MPFGRGQVHEPSIGEDADLPAVVQLVLLDELARLRGADREIPDRVEIELVVEVPRVGRRLRRPSSV